MSRLKLFLLSVCAAMSIGSVFAQSAFAEREVCVTLNWTLCLEEGSTGTLWENAETKLVVFDSELQTEAGWEEALFEAPALGIHIDCTRVNNTGEFEQTPLVTQVLVMSLVLAFSHCEVLEHQSECVLREPFTTLPLDGTILSTEDTEFLDIDFSPEAGTEWFRWDFLNNGSTECPATLSGEQTIKGTQLCELIEAELDLLSHLLNCEPGTELRYGTTEETLEFLLMENVLLIGAFAGKKWDIALA